MPRRLGIAGGRRARPLALLAAATLAVCGCATPVKRAQQIARQGALAPLTLPGSRFQHTAFARVTDGDALLILFIEGDGTPWVQGGRVIAADPTSRRPLMLELAAGTRGSVLYLGRPCYFAAHSDPACDPRWWTSERYGQPVVASMAAAAERFRQEHHLGRILLVGHSGGGTLAVLLAHRLPQVAGVVSIAGNLDPAEWTRQNGYLPLTGSLDPALEPPLDPALPQWYLEGGRDRVVPEKMAARYLARVPAERIWRYPDFTHMCCWRRVWPQVHARVMGELAAEAPAAPGTGVPAR
jgi:poly(3-hydroxybutyrate) depolymerase